MPSPFPGMNPYLEQTDTWQDFHERFIVHAAAVIGAQVRAICIVRINQHVHLREPAAEERLAAIDQDVRLGGGTGTAERDARLPVDVERQSFVEVRGREDRQLVAVIELLSPANKKPGPDREQYLAKRRQLLASSAHLIEIDLLRGGPRLPLEDLPDCDYYAIVSRAEERPRVGVWPIRLRDPLPAIPVPLRPPDPDARLDLQKVLRDVYDAANYADYVYAGSPQPPLHPQDAAWAREMIPKAQS